MSGSGLPLPVAAVATSLGSSTPMRNIIDGTPWAPYSAKSSLVVSGRLRNTFVRAECGSQRGLDEPDHGFAAHHAVPAVASANCRLRRASSRRRGQRYPPHALVRCSVARCPGVGLHADAGGCTALPVGGVNHDRGI